MAQISKAVVDSNIRTQVFDALGIGDVDGYQKVNDRQWGTIVTDENGVERYVRIGAIVAEIKDDMTAREYMQKEINDYNAAQAKKAERAAARAEKAAKDAATRAAKEAEKTDE